MRFVGNSDLLCSCLSLVLPLYYFFFFFNDTATTEIYTLSLHDALPISWPQARGCPAPSRRRTGSRRGRRRGVFLPRLDRPAPLCVSSCKNTWAKEGSPARGAGYRCGHLPWTGRVLQRDSPGAERDPGENPGSRDLPVAGHRRAPI